MIDIGEFHRLRGEVPDVRQVLLGGPKFDEVTDVLAAIKAERSKADFGRAVGLEAAR